MNVILRDIKPEDLMLGVRAAQFLLARPKNQDAWLSYGDGHKEKEFYAKRNKASITVRGCVGAVGSSGATND